MDSETHNCQTAPAKTDRNLTSVISGMAFNTKGYEIFQSIVA
jgi:hypothetical protein